MRIATVSFCPDLTDPDAESTPVFYVAEDESGFTVRYALLFSEITDLVKRDNLSLHFAQMFPWWLADFYEQSTPQFFLQDLASCLLHSSFFVSDVSEANPNHGSLPRRFG